MTRTISGLYDSYDDAEAVVRDLKTAGISEQHISMVANNTGDSFIARHKQGNEAGQGAENGAALGVVLGGGAGLLTGLGLLAIPGVGPVVAAGWLVATAVGALGGGVVGGAGGGMIGAMIGNGIAEETANVYVEGIRRGGTLVTVQVDDRLAPTAEAIMHEYHLVNTEARRDSYRAQGWTRFDEKSLPYTQAEMDQARKSPETPVVM